MISSLLFDLSSALRTTVANEATDYPIINASIVFNASDYKNETLIVYRPEKDKSYLFTSNGIDWTPLQS